MLTSLCLLLSILSLHGEDSSSSSSLDSSSDNSSSESSSSTDEVVPAVVKSVLATSNYVDAYNSVMYMLPTAESQEIAINECGDSGKEIWSDNMFQLHQPYVPIHNAGRFQPLMVESAFYQKWLNYQQSVIALDGDYSDISDITYEPFFDHSFALYKSSIFDNIEVIQDQSNSNLNWEILYTFMKWTLIEEVDGKSDFISLLMYVPSTQVTIELITEYTSDYDQYLENEVVFQTGPRMSFKGFADYTYPWNSEYTVVPIKQSRYVTDVEINVAWYVEFMNAEILMSGEAEINGNIVKYTNVYLDYAHGFELAFYSFSRDDSYGEFSIDTYEKGINSIHRDYITSSACGFNRWFDNHYALSMIQSNDEFKEIYDKVAESGQRYILFAYTTALADEFGREGLSTLGIDYFFLLYTIEPNGNTIEIVGYFENDELAYSTVKWEGEFCPEKCTTKAPFPSNFIDNGQYTSYGKTLPKYQSTLPKDKKETANKAKVPKKDKLSKLVSKSGSESLLNKPKPIPKPNVNKNNHKKNSQNIPILVITGLVIAFAIFAFSYLLYAIYKNKNKKQIISQVSERRPLKPKYGSTV